MSAPPATSKPRKQRQAATLLANRITHAKNSAPQDLPTTSACSVHKENDARPPKKLSDKRRKAQVLQDTKNAVRAAQEAAACDRISPRTHADTVQELASAQAKIVRMDSAMLMLQDRLIAAQQRADSSEQTALRWRARHDAAQDNLADTTRLTQEIRHAEQAAASAQRDITKLSATVNELRRELRAAKARGVRAKDVRERAVTKAVRTALGKFRRLHLKQGMRVPDDIRRMVRRLVSEAGVAHANVLRTIHIVAEAAALDVIGSFTESTVGNIVNEGDIISLMQLGEQLMGGECTSQL